MSAPAPEASTLCASNRGDDSMAVFGIADDTGMLTFLEAMPSGGRTPRFFSLSPNGKFLFALNEDSDNIVSFAVHAATGRLAPTDFSLACGSPVCMVFALSSRPLGMPVS